MHILIVEDNRDIADNIADYLESQGYTFDFAMDGRGALRKARSDEFDLIVLDIMLPGIDGFEVCKALRDQGRRQVPIIMLTARDTLEDKLEGFELGASDYLVKPFALQELGARIRVQIKHRQERQAKTICVGDLKLLPETRVVLRDGKPLKLNNTCFQILHILMLASPRVVNKRELEMEVWQDAALGSDVLRTNIYTLRSIIDKPFAQPMLYTEHGVGYSIRKP